ncbi:MAG: 30S ribosomal protein S1 [Planctomycetota bacterium]|nr:30S ribosomal protein S1 [Planctomycetota bacterium]
MVNRNLIREFGVSDEELEKAFGESLKEIDSTTGNMDAIYNTASDSYELNTIIEGTVLRVEGDDVLIDIGYKSEGMVPVEEFREEDELQIPETGSKVSVLLEEIEDEFGLIILSKRKADRIREWEEVIENHSEDDIVTGEVLRKIKGGLLVNIGVNVFLPASQVDIRRPHDIGAFVGQEIQCVILKIDEARRNIVVSRRKLIEEERNKMKEALMSDISEGELRTGTVKNIADFGAFVDLGGIDGLLHITDMSWARINHPSDMVKIEEEIEVMILNIDREKEKIALGLKQKTPSPWEGIEDKFPVESRVTGEVVNVMTYGAFVKLEDGIEGLVHISEMSWTKRINHPTELVNIGDEVEVVVLGINQDKKEISLGMKQTTPNPWDDVAAKYPPGTTVEGTVRNLTNYGAFVELEEGVDGLLHVSDMSWTRKIGHASELLEKGDAITCQVLTVDEERRRIALGLKQLEEDPWETDIPKRFAPGSTVHGEVTKVTNFGVFIQLESNLEGLLHISELADYKVEDPEDVVQVGETLEVRVLRVDTEERKIGLSRRLDIDPEELIREAEAADAASAAAKEDLRGGTGTSSGPLFQLGADGQPTEVANEDADASGEGDAEAVENAEEEADGDAGAADDAEEEADGDAEAADDAEGETDGDAEAADDAEGETDGDAEAADDAEGGTDGAAEEDS